MSDVIIENNTTGVMAKLGLDYETVRAWKDDLIYVSMPSFGYSGPYRAFQGFGSNVEALCGFTAVRGYANAPLTTNTGVYYMDAASSTGGHSPSCAPCTTGSTPAKVSTSIFRKQKTCCRTLASTLWMRP